ncbi:response regulator transcription factor [Phytoactinopolyspora alkaliphila]|uniref:Response regulator transcription factor n=1 Tax=Phytoactinopolyspora alkaliphila TaxID=1783498 RepID=A0A6N9YGG8_9ACTN|nr:response regulator transcription factor [Phytoactinopolyspora alkaliphila]
MRVGLDDSCHPVEPRRKHARRVTSQAARADYEIADALVLAEQTVKTHVGRILTKLDLRDRAQGVVVAYQTGLVQPGG